MTGGGTYSLAQAIVEVAGHDALLVIIGVALGVGVLGLKQILDFVLVLTGRKKLPNPDNAITRKEFSAMTDQNGREHEEMRDAVRSLTESVASVSQEVALLKQKLEHIDSMIERLLKGK